MLFFQYPVCEESPQLGASRPYTFDVHKESQSKEGDEQHTQDFKRSEQQHAHKSHKELATQLKNSTRALYAITMKRVREINVLVLRNVVGMLGVLLHAPRGPFYSPKVARSR